MLKIVGIMNAFRSLVKFGLSQCAGGFGWHWCREREYMASQQGGLEYGMVDPNSEFHQETFEGPSLRGGYDNQWVGRDFHSHTAYGEVVVDPLNPDNHVYHPIADHHARFYSAPAKKQSGGTVVKFKYYASEVESGGCIGYYERPPVAEDERLYYVDWMFFDARSWYADFVMIPIDNAYISCQFEIPSDVEEFRIIVGDRIREIGDSYFDDIVVTSGTGSSCNSDIGTLTPTGIDGQSSRIVDKLATLLTGE